VLHVLMDNDHRIEWVDRLYTNHVLSRESEWDYVLYQAFDLPATFASRDYVYHGQVSQTEAGVVTLSMQSIEHADAPETVGVRAKLINSRYVLTPIDGGGTRVEVEIVTDPKGWMPIWLVNLVQKSWPVETLNGIRAQFPKDHMGDYPLPMYPGQAEAEAEAEAEAKAEAEAAAAEEAAAEEAAAEEGAEGDEGDEAAE
jgi:hypothetical protein